MTVEKFWDIIELIDIKQVDKQKATEKVIHYLAQLPDSEIYAFEEIMSQMLYQIDTQEHAENLGEYSFGTDPYFSGDYFLYVRCFVVAYGRKFYEQVLSNPKMMPAKTFEPLLYIAGKAYSKKTGKDQLEILPSTSYETYSNQSGWQNTGLQFDLEMLLKA